MAASLHLLELILICFAAQHLIAADNVLLHCPEKEIDDSDLDGEQCQLLKVYNYKQVERDFEPQELDRILIKCACQLNSLNWEDAYDDHSSSRQLDSMVRKTLLKEKYLGNAAASNMLPANSTLPPYLWNDVDTLIKGVSIRTATKDFFEKRKRKNAIAQKVFAEFQRDQALRTVTFVCFKIAADKRNLYGYLENLARLSPTRFYNLLEANEVADIIYQASKACKMLLLDHFEQYKLRPENEEFVPILKDQSLLTIEQQLINSNSIEPADDDHLEKQIARDSSLWFVRCKLWRGAQPKSFEQLEEECPMMCSDKLPAKWVEEHKSDLVRSQAAVKCACELLLHNSTWQTLMNDESIKTLSKALLTYMNMNAIPNLNEAQLWQFYGWFSETMREFVENRKKSLKQITRILNKNQDPLNKLEDSNSDDEAIELMRRACNLLMFNLKPNSEGVREIKLIKYLDNLQFVSEDPLFVFHLTLQDFNLFKLHAISKMCKPFGY